MSEVPAPVERPRPWVRVVTVAAVVLVSAGLLWLLYEASVHAFPGDSDGATVALEGLVMSQGHLTLHGWAMSLDSFWLVDTLFYLVAAGLGGLTLGLLHFVPALIALLVILVGCFIAAEGNRGGGAVVGALVVVALLGFPTHTMAYFFLRGPLHVGTTLWCLLAFVAVRRGRFGWGFVLAMVLLAAGMLGDLQALALGVVPLGLAGLVAMARSRSWRGGIVAVTAAAGSVALAEVVRQIAKAVGTFTIAKANPRATFAQMRINVHHAVTETAQLFGVTSRDFGNGGTPSWLQDFHVIGFALVIVMGVLAVVALVFGAVLGRSTVPAWPLSRLWSAPRPELPDLRPVSMVPWRRSAGGEAPLEPWRMDDMITIACFAPAAAYVVLAVMSDVQYGRYLTAGVIFSSILAGRLVGRLVTTVQERTAATSARKVAGGVLAAAGLALMGLFLAGTLMTLTQPAPVQTASQLAVWLEQHHLTQGLGSYWSGNIVTVTSDDKVKVRAVVTEGGKLRRYERQSPAAWYAGQKFHFVVYDLDIPWGGVGYKTAVKTFGPPTRFVAVGPYRVLVYSKPLMVAP